MKLLPPREVETHTNAKKAAEIQRITAIRSQLSREELELNTWNDTIEAKKRAAAEDFEKKVIVFNAELRQIQEEVEELEEKREKLLRPLDDTPEVITKNLAVTEELLNYLAHRKKELLQAKQTLEQSQKDADRQLAILLEKEKALSEREKGIAEGEKTLSEGKKTLSRSAERFTQESNAKNIGLMLFEQELKRKEVELAEREELVAQGNEKIVKDRARIESQQQALIAAMQDAKNKGIL